MSRKKSGTQLRSQGNTGGTTDRRLAHGLLIVIDGDTVGRRSLKRAITRVLGPDVATFPDLSALQAYIHPHSTRRAGRPPVRGFLIDWELGKRRGAPLLEVMTWLDGVYPRTPVVTYTGAPDLSDIHRMCAGREHEVVALRKRARASDPFRHAALAIARLPIQQTAILARSGLTDEVLRWIEEVWFTGWEERRLHARCWLMAQLPSGTEACEYHLRTIEAYFESLTRGELAHARGVSKSTIAQHEKEIASVWGEPLTSLKQRWERDYEGRGASLPSPLVEAMSFGETAPHDEIPRPARRPSARRSR